MPTLTLTLDPRRERRLSRLAVAGSKCIKMVKRRAHSEPAKGAARPRARSLRHPFPGRPPPPEAQPAQQENELPSQLKTLSLLWTGEEQGGIRARDQGAPRFQSRKEALDYLTVARDRLYAGGNELLRESLEFWIAYRNERIKLLNRERAMVHGLLDEIELAHL